MTKTARFSYAMNRGANFVWTKIFDPAKVSREECEKEDCLHRDYGTPMTAHCAVCHDSIFMNKRQLGKPEVQEKLKNICRKCQMPPADDPPMYPPYDDYELPKELQGGPEAWIKPYEEYKKDRIE